ncbi:lamin tail domain-containing protein [Brevibacterium litoralis]|uniref:lamin tail domain-containing protein n=1 Tax=Brevibacterium litoralis TaxID=3138935 RepID=UPI0032ED5884
MRTLLSSTAAVAVVAGGLGLAAPATATPTTDPTASPSAEPTTTEPTAASAAPVLQVTEVAPDTANVGGSDGYEFVEVYNPTDAAIDFSDYSLQYLYTDNSLDGPVTTNSALWPAVPGDVTIPAGETLVLWVVNPAGQEAGLTVADFNANYGSDLVEGEDIARMYVGGMANGGSRGLQVVTSTGHDVSRAYYFDNDQTTSTTSIGYAWNPDTTEVTWVPNPVDGTVQTMLGLDTPTPGAVSEVQTPAAPAPAPTAGEAPAIEDHTTLTEDDLTLDFTVTDDTLVRTVTLELTDNLGATETRNLTVGLDPETGEPTDRYTYSIPAVDTYGKQWLEYSVIASDGTQTSTLDRARIDLVDGDRAPVRLQPTDGQIVSGEVPVTGTTDGDPASLDLTVDDESFTDTTPSLETSPVFALEATSTDAFFRNGITVDGEELTIFDQGFYDSTETVDATIPVDKVVQGEPLTVTVTAGTKAWPRPDVNENNDDFSALNMRLALPDGRVLRPDTCTTAAEVDGAVTEHAAVECPAPEDTIRFSDGSLVEFEATFDVPDDAFDSRVATWDTTTATDGEHTLAATDGTDTAESTVQVDNTAPVIETDLVDGELYRGDLTIDATATDAIAGLEELTATLDREPITLPYSTSSLELEPGEHTVTFTARDAVGNAVTQELTVESADEAPAVDLQSPADGAEVQGTSTALEATASSPEDDALDLSFREGHALQPGDEGLTVSEGTTTDALAGASGAEREATVLDGADLEALVGTDGVEVETSSETTLPYQLFTVDVPADAGEDARVRVDWTGRANLDAKVRMYVLGTDGVWQGVDEYVTTEGAGTEFTLDATVPVAETAIDGQVQVLVQHSEGFAAGNLSERTDDVTPYHPEATPRDAYDFTVAVETDTQYYNETDAYHPHQLAIHDFLLQQRENLNLQYLIHDGDIVNVHTEQHQWDKANAAYDMLDEAGLPYGVLAGNHDVGGHADDYSAYSEHFGEARFADNPWYGESYKDNRGHYDLVSAGGVDFLMLYMGWPTTNDEEANSEDIAWMNEVIAQYPERKVWINLHEYLQTTGGLGPFPQRVQDEVVATNPNVFAVSSGHYHDAFTRTDSFDDDGDGVDDRTVYQMLFDYQGLPEGGQGYLRLAHFDNEAGEIVFRTYSPSLEDFDSDNAALNDPPGMQEFTIPYAEVGIEPRTKVLAADSFSADVLTGNEIGAVAGAASGESVSVDWDGLEAGSHGWYVEATGPHGGAASSEVWTFTADGVPTDPEAPAEFEQVGEPTIDAGVKGVKPGSVLRVDPGTWSPEPSFSYQWKADGEPIADATGETFRLTGKYKGQDVTVQVTAEAEGYETTTVESEPVRWK